MIIRGGGMKTRIGILLDGNKFAWGGGGGWLKTIIGIWSGGRGKFYWCV